MTLAVPTVAAGERRQRRGRVSFSDLDASTRRYVKKATVTLFAVMLVTAYLLPLAYGFISGLKSEEQMTDPHQPILPKSAETATIDGEEVPILLVPFEDGTRELALVDRGRESSVFVDPDEPDVLIEWEGRWRTLEPATSLDPQWDNFSTAAEASSCDVCSSTPPSSPDSAWPAR